MTITVSNQKPAVLDPVFPISCAGDFDPIKALDATVIAPLTTPITPGAAVSITDAKGQDQIPQLQRMITDCLNDTIDVAAEAEAKTLLGQTLINFDARTTMPVNELFAIQAGHQHSLPDPAPNVIYNATNAVIPSAKELLAQIAQPSEFFAALAYTYHPRTLGFWFQSQQAFDDYKIYLNNQVQALSTSSTMPANTATLITEFNKLTLKGLTESLLLRQDENDNNEEFSFARFIINSLMNYTRQQNNPQQQNSTAQGGTTPVVGVLPFNLNELFVPRSLVLVNVEAHARSTANKINREWNLINQSLSSPVKIVSNKKLAQLTSLARASAKAAALSAIQRPGQPGSRSAQVKFRKMPPSKIDLYKDLLRALKRMGRVNRSMNVFRSVKTTFAKPNRRNPDDYNKPGKNISIHYMPDIHVFLDTSGSISEENYQESVLMLIKIAKKLNVNLYFNSFSHILSAETKLRVENKSTAAIWREFRKVPKVTGGTEFSQVWDYINLSATRRGRLSLMITDFEWSPPSSRKEHPPNLYYAPCSAMDWNRLINAAQYYTRSMKHIDPSIQQKLMGLIL